MSELKKTPLYPLYEQYGAKTIDFGGWDLPVQFSSIKEEHNAVRTAAGLFDVSHMGEVEIEGSDALSFLQKMTTNDVSKLSIGQAQYTFMCDADGGTVDDLLIYRKGEGLFFLVLNASNKDADIEWLLRHQEGDVRLTDVSAETALLALQGPLAEQVLSRLTDEDLTKIGFFRFKHKVNIAGHDVLVSRTGYTGEDGFEMYGTPEKIVELWDRILAAGKDDGVLPCGLGARDTLRFEAGLPLYGQELSRSISPIEAGFGFAVKVDQPTPFIGQEVLQKQKEAGATRRLVGIEMIDRGIPRTGYPIFLGEDQIGEVTSGTQSPTLSKSIGFALIQKEAASLDAEVTVEIRGKQVKAKIVKTPFYKQNK